MLTDEDKKRIEDEEKYRAQLRKGLDKKPRGIISKVFRFILFSFVVLIGLIVVVRMVGSNSEVSGGKVGAAPTNPSQKAETDTRQFLDLSCEEFSRTFGTDKKLSDLQKDELFKQYDGKYVRWTAKVGEISSFLGTLKAQIKCLPTTLVLDATVAFEDSERDALMALRKDQRFKFEARLDRYGSIIGHSLSQGRVLKN